MHGWVDSEISAVLLALIVIVVVSLAFAQQATSRSNPRPKRSQRFGVDAGIVVEKEAQSEADQKSMLATNNACAICQNPTTRRCSRCKSARYCSNECQVVHWKQGHKNECRPPVASSLGSAENESGIMCNGKHLEKSKSLESTPVLNPISLGVFKSDSNKLTDADKKSLPSQKAPCNTLTTDGSLPKPKTILFPYDYFVKLFEWDFLSVPCGLINCGNSCFANVVLQCLTYTRPLTAYLLDGFHGEDCMRNDWCFMCELQSHVRKVRQNQNPFSPIRILSRIRNIGNHLGYGRQEDAHEFMRFAIDSMQSICLDEVGGEKAVDPATQETTLIHHIFGGHLQSQVKCMQCQHESNRYESMMDLAVEIHGVVESLEDAIAQFTTTEMLDGDNKYKCDRCNAYVRARKRLTVHEAPNILTIALKRFQSGKFGKLNKRVTFPEVLDMSPYMSGRSDEPLLYRLYAVVVHVDMLNASFFGHYICYVKDSNGVWYKIDDSKVKEVELEKVMTQRAYMLFYSRSEARKAPTTEGQPSASLAASLSASRKIRTSICMEPQRSSIFPPTLGPVPIDLSRDYLNDSEPIRLKLFEEKTEFPDRKHLQRSEDIIEVEDDNIGEAIEEREETNMVPTSTVATEEQERAEESVSPDDLGPLVDLIICSSSNGASASQTPNCSLSSDGNVEQNGLPLDATSNDPDRGRAKLTQEHLSVPSAPKRLDIDQLEVFPLVDQDSFSPRSQVQDFGRTSSSTSAWAGGIEDLFPSNFSMFPDYHAASNLFDTVAEKEGQSFNEADAWNVAFGRAKRQHIEDTSGRLGSADASLNGDSQYMDIDEGNTSAVDGVLDPQGSFKSPSDEGAGFSSVSLDTEKKSGNGGLPQSSKALLELESLCSERALDMERDDLTSSIRIHGVGIGPMGAESSSESSSLLQPSHRGRVLIEELPGPAIDIRKDTSTAKVTRSGIEIREEAYGVGPMEDDIPYVVVEPISVEPAIPQHYEEPPLPQQDLAGQSMEASTKELRDTIMESASAVTSTADTTDNVAVVKEESKPNSDIKRKKQTSKPLFSPGFLIKSSRPTSAKSLNRSPGAVANGGGGGSGGEGEGQSHFIEASQGLSNGRPATALVTNGAEGEAEGLITNGKLSSQVTSNGNHSNGKPVSRKKLNDPPLDSGRENGASLAVVDRAESMKHKQGRNESCACGSQQKWKKCCGKATVLKGGLATKQLTVGPIL